MNKPTIIDISKATGFAKSTVSKALNNSKEISKKTKDIIKSYAQKVNLYVYPVLASLATLILIIVGIPISKDLSNKNNCVNTAKKMLTNKLPEDFINDSKLNKRDLLRMHAYKLCLK